MAGNYITNNEPYVLRPSAGDIRSTTKLIGGTVAWNQLINGYSQQSGNVSTDFTNGVYTLTGTPERAYFSITRLTGGTTTGHKYLGLSSVVSNPNDLSFNVTSLGSSEVNPSFNLTPTARSRVFNCSKSISENVSIGIFGTDAGLDYTGVKVKVVFFDLTAMFGTTIADYIYSLEQSTAGAGVAFFRSLFPNDYYPYDAGSLKSVEGVSAHETVGFNQWDEEWEVGGYAGATGAPWNTNTRIRSKTTNYISVLPDTTYYACMPSGSGMYLDVMFYDADKTFISTTNPSAGRTFTTPSNTRFMRFATSAQYGTTYNHDICINLSDASRNGEYEPYSKHTYSLDSTLTLRGIPKLDSSNHLYYDGDTYESDGTVTRRYAFVNGAEMTLHNTSSAGYKTYRVADANAKTSGEILTNYTQKRVQSFDSATAAEEYYQFKNTGSNYIFFVVSPTRDINAVQVIYELATPTTETARSFSASQVVNKYGTEEFAYDEDVLPVPVGHETTYLSKEDKSEKGEYLNAAGLSYFWEKVKSFFAKRIGFPEAPYKEVEWVESNGKQFVYLDWHPPIATWGFEADFLIRNAFNTSVGAWNTSTNANGYGNVFGTRNSSTVNDIQYGSYSTYGTLRIGSGNAATSASGTMKTDKTRQHASLIGTTFSKPNGTNMTLTRASETANKPYANMVVFAMHEGIRRASSGNVSQPGSVRIYSLKFYEGTTVVVNLVGAIRKSDGVTGLYDKVAGHFYPAPGMTYGNDVGDLGSTETVLETAKSTIVQGTANNLTHRRMWTVNVPTLSKLVDGQKLSITPMYTVVASVESDLATTDDSGNNTYVYLKLTLADGNTTDWIPCYYMGATRLTSHYGAGHPILFTYHENAFYGATDTGSGNAIMRGMFADPNYNTDRYYDVYSDTVIAGANGIKRYTLCMQDSTGKWTSIVNEANSSGATGKTCYTGGLRLGKVLYHSAGAEYASGANSGIMWQTYAFDARYSMNGIANAASTTLEMRKPFYLVGTLHSDGLFYLDTTKWWTQTEPTTEDGKVYLLVGWAYSSYYAVYLAAHNPAYVFKNGKLQELTNTHVVDVDVPANAKFTDTVTTATTSGSGNAVTAITASNGALTVTKGTTFLTSHQDISGKIDASTKGAANGVCPLNSSAKVDETYLSTATPTAYGVVKLDSSIASSAQANPVTGGAIYTALLGKANDSDVIKKNANGNTQQLARPKYKNGAGDNTLDGKIRSLRANRLAFLPADQIIIEKTTDGGTTWTDAGVVDSVKESLFAETRPNVAIPLLNGVRSLNCGIRITFTAMKYNVPAGTSETQKYNYWNSQYINSAERYCQLKEMYFFVSSSSDTISVKLERAKGDINNHGWVTSFEQPSWGMTGWSGSDYIRFEQNNFGGSIAQTSNWWNYRLTFMTRGVNGTETMATTYTTSAQTILEIRGYGDTYWTKGCEYAAEDKMYTHDYLKNVTFPAKVNATEFVGKVNATEFVGGTLGVDHGGTGKTTAKAAANVFINALDTGASTPADNDYYISQYVNGGTTTTTYHRRPMSTLWAYIQSKISSVLGLTSTAYGGTSAKATADASGNTITSTYLTKAAGVTDISWDSDSGMLKKTKNGSVSIVTPLSTAALTGSYDDLSDKPTISTLGGIPTSQKAAANGVASLGSDGKVPGAQLPDNANLSAVEARVTALEGLLNVVESWSPSTGYSIASSSSWSAALGSKAFQLAKGTYIVMFGADFSSNASGYRMVQINTSAAGNRYTPTGPAVNGNNTRLMGTVLLEPTATTNYYMYVFQNSGATLTVTPWARIIKIG